MRSHDPIRHPSLDEILASDGWARAKTADLAGGN
jgi:hypothetical protein